MQLPPDIEQIRSRIQAGDRLPIRVVSGSMEPVIMTGEMIEVAPVDWDELRVFDILLFWNGADRLICHYLWHINLLPGPDGSPVIVTRALPGGEDLPTPRDWVLGCVVSHRIPSWTRAKLLLKHRFSRARRGLMS